MKIAVFSDIHGNKYSFKKAISKMDQIGIDKYICCGDIVGYYYYHNEVINMLRGKTDIYCVLGNHDQMFIDIIDGRKDCSTYIKKYGSSIQKFINTITKENLEFLRSLLMEEDILIDGLSIKIVHGSPWNPLNEYIYPDSDFERYFKIDSEYDYVFQGHTHYPMRIKVKKCEIVNPGSIGQPRNGGYPTFAVLDTKTKLFEFVSEKYDIHKLVQDIQRVGGEPSYISNVLRRPLDEG